MSGFATTRLTSTTIHRLLKPRGLYLHHAIARRSTRNDKSFRKKPEHLALQRYIFPGGEVDHLAMSIANLERHRPRSVEVRLKDEHLPIRSATFKQLRREQDIKAGRLPTGGPFVESNAACPVLLAAADP
jgi:hypothetical protein